MPGIRAIRRVRRFALSTVVALGLVVPFLAVGGWTSLAASASGNTTGLLSQAISGRSTSAAPAPQSTAVPGGTGATRQSMVVGLEAPDLSQQLHTDRDFLIVGYALDQRATINQGAQGSG